MSFEKLLGVTVEREIQGVKLKLEQLTVKDYGKMMQFEQEKNQESIKELIFDNLKRSNPGLTDEILKNLKLSAFIDIIEAIMDISEIKIDRKKLEVTE